MNPFKNHLINESSPYLLQHAYNPVDWYPWGKEAFEQAKREDKPILLSIGYSTCHWCHVMAHESFEDAAIAEVINQKFVSIKVDREERPDIDHVYMTAVTALGSQGGWPLTVFLTPDGHPFYGGTYFPPYAKWGAPGFIDVLESISNAWIKERQEILQSGQSITSMIHQHLQNRAPGGMIEHGLLQKALTQLSSQFDSTNGGFGSAPKFPMPHVLLFLLRQYRFKRDEHVLAMILQTLSSMRQGGIWDHVGFGFHRYSTDERWHIPHFEKMLYDQALLARAYLEGYQVSGESVLAQTAQEIFAYVLRDMRHTEGGFFSAEDADSKDGQGHMREGAFYVWSQREIESILKEDAPAFMKHYGVHPNGNADHDPHQEFVGQNILYQAESLAHAAQTAHRSTDEIDDLLKDALAQLFNVRSQRPRPHLDDKVLTDWNGLMIASLAFGGRVLSDQAFTGAAKSAADFILKNMYVNGRLLHRWRNGNVGIEGTLEDYAFFVYGLIELYEATFESLYLEKAYELTNTMIDLFEDKEKGGFFLTARDGEPLIFRPKDVYDGAIPSGTSVALSNLLKLYTSSQNPIYIKTFEAAVKSCSEVVSHSAGSYAFLLCAVSDYLQGPLEMTFRASDPNDAGIAKMLKVVYKHFVPHKVMVFKKGPDAQVLLCRTGICLAPIKDVESLEAELIK